MINKVQIRIIQFILLCENVIIKLFHLFLWGKRKNCFVIDNICVFKIGNIGDLLCSIPSFECIKRTFPHAKLTLFTNGGSGVDARYTLNGYDTFDMIEVYEQKLTKSFKGIKDIAHRIENCNFDYVIYLPAERAKLKNLLRDMLMIKMSRIPYASGFAISTTRCFPKAQARYIHFDREVIRQFRLLPNKCNNTISYKFNISMNDKKMVDQFLRDQHLENRKILILSMRGKADVNVWPQENFLSIANEWNSKYGGSVIAIGGLEQEQYINNTFANDVINAAGKFSISQSIYLISRAAILLTVDTGTAHMAPIADTPCVVISSSYYFPEKWMPYGDKVHVLRNNISCSPCLKETCPLGTNACINGISIEEVWNTINMIMKE